MACICDSVAYPCEERKEEKRDNFRRREKNAEKERKERKEREGEIKKGRKKENLWPIINNLSPHFRANPRIKRRKKRGSDHKD